MLKAGQFEEGKRCLERGEYLAALECFLSVRASHLLALLHTASNYGCIRSLQTFDIDQNGAPEIGVLSQGGRLMVLSHDGAIVMHDFDQIPACESFCFYQGRNKSPQLAIATSAAHASTVTVRAIDGRETPLLATLDHLGSEKILDLAAFSKRLVVSTGQKLLRYNVADHRYRDTTEYLGDDIVRLCVKPEPDGEPNPKPATIAPLLALTRDGSLCLFENSHDGLRLEGELAVQESIVDATVADIESDGVQEFVACTANGCVLVYEVGKPQPKYMHTCFDELSSVACHSLGTEPRVEILTAGSRGYIYALEVNEARKLVEKWRLKVPGPVTALHFFESRTRSRLFAGLATGQILMWDLVAERDLTPPIYAAHTEQARKDPVALESFLTGSSSPDIVRYGLNE